MREISIAYGSPSCVFVSGFGARDLTMKVTTRAPVWSAVARGWVMQPHRVPDLIAICEARGYTVLLDAELVTSVASSRKVQGVAQFDPPDESDLIEPLEPEGLFQC